MARLWLLLPVVVAALWFLQRYREGHFRRRRGATATVAPGPPPVTGSPVTGSRTATAGVAAGAGAAGAPSGEPAWEFRPEEYGLVPDDQLNTKLAGPDPELTGALRAASTGDWRPASALLAGSDPEWRWVRLSALAKAAAEDDSWLRAWLAGYPDDPGVALVRAQSLVELAWKLRGNRQAQSTTPEQFENFHRVLAQAPAALGEAARLVPADPSPYIGMIHVAFGEGWPHERMRALWTEVTARAPYHVGAHAAALQYWCAKWCGSTELMHAFAESAAAAAPPGSLLPMLRLVATYEELLGQRSDHPGYHTARTAAAIDALLADVAVAPPGHAWLPAARHLLVWFLRAQKRLPEAAEQLRLVDGYIGALPWRYHPDPVSFYVPTRQHVILAAERIAREAGLHRSDWMTGE